MLDEKYLLAHSNASRLSEIEDLMLNDLNLCDDDLNPEVFNQLTVLEEINLSGNKLTCIPNGIVFPRLEYLDMSKNCMSDVSWLARFPNIKDLDVADNVALTIDDTYKIKFLLKKLQFLDGKRVDDRGKIGEEFTIALIEKLQTLWDSEFCKKWNEAETEQEKKSRIMDEFLSSAIGIKYGPNSLKGYRKWRIENIVDEFMIKKLLNPNFCFENISLQSSPKDMCLSNGASMNKHQLSECGKVDGFPQKAAKIQSINSYSKSFEPVIFLQCHSQQDGADDFSTQVWCCMFEPDVNDTSKTTNKVATCGGCTITIVDCETHKADARFEQANEEFYTLAWTTVQINGLNTNLLVAGGCLGFLHLIHPEQAVCYGRIKVHKSPIQTVRFLNSTQLISAEKKGKIYLIDIDVPTIPGYKFNWKKVATFSGVDCAPLRLMVKEDCLFTGTEMGLFVWKDEQICALDRDLAKPKLLSLWHELKFPGVPNESMVDAIDALNDDLIASKCAQQEVIFVWKFSDVSQQLALKRSKSSKVKVSLLAKLSWSTTKQCYINFTICQAYNTLLIGDDMGSLYVYNLRDFLKHPKVLSAPILPVSIVPFPHCTRNDKSKLKEFSQMTIFNDITCSWNLNHVVVACDNNLVGIFRKK